MVKLSIAQHRTAFSPVIASNTSNIPVIAPAPAVQSILPTPKPQPVAAKEKIDKKIISFCDVPKDYSGYRFLIVHDIYARYFPISKSKKQKFDTLCLSTLTTERYKASVVKGIYGKKEKMRVDYPNTDQFAIAEYENGKIKCLLIHMEKWKLRLRELKNAGHEYKVQIDGCSEEIDPIGYEDMTEIQSEIHMVHTIFQRQITKKFSCDNIPKQNIKHISAVKLAENDIYKIIQS